MEKAVKEENKYVKRNIIIVSVMVSFTTGLLALLCFLFSVITYPMRLCEAIYNEDYNKIERITNSPGNINGTPMPDFFARFIDASNHPPLLAACRKNNYKIVKLLVEKGADVNIEEKIDTFTISPIMMRCSFEINAYLIEQGADINYVNKEREESLLSTFLRGTRVWDKETQKYINKDYDKERNQYDELLYYVSKGMKITGNGSSYDLLDDAVGYCDNSLVAEYLLGNAIFDVNCGYRNSPYIVTAAKKAAQIL